MNRIHSAFLASLVLLCCAADAASGATFFGPSPYQSFADSPFAPIDFDYFHLEDFEDSALNTPGVSASNGMPLNFGSLRDSVDGDDGSIDGSGSDGFSWYVTSTTVAFTFDANALGSLPTHAGMVFTDIGFVLSGTDGISPITFEAFDANNVSLGTVGPVVVGDGAFAGHTGEDRFFGVQHPAGISRIVFTANSQDWELDHVQYGAAPEPGTWCLLLMAFAASICRRSGARR